MNKTGRFVATLFTLAMLGGSLVGCAQLQGMPSEFFPASSRSASKSQRSAMKSQPTGVKAPGNTAQAKQNANAKTKSKGAVASKTKPTSPRTKPLTSLFPTLTPNNYNSGHFGVDPRAREIESNLGISGQ